MELVLPVALGQGHLGVEVSLGQGQLGSLGLKLHWESKLHLDGAKLKRTWCQVGPSFSQVGPSWGRVAAKLG